MAHIQKYFIAEILQKVCEEMYSISEYVFSEHRPSAMGEQMNDFIVVSLPVAIEEQNAYQKTTLRIELAAKDKANGISDTEKLQSMLNELASKFPIVESRFSVTSPNVVLKGTDGLGFTLWNVQSKLLINTTDSYQNN
jgi:hypothetical protein